MVRKPGRPTTDRTDANEEELRTVSFCADPSTIAALMRLERSMLGPQRGRRSQAIRKAIADADAAARGK